MVKGLVAKLWHGWKEIAGYIGDFQARVLLTVFYFTVLLPFGLLVRLFGDPLLVRRGPAKSGWVPRKNCETDLSKAKRQF
jgi:hypothetical protein